MRNDAALPQAAPTEAVRRAAGRRRNSHDKARQPCCSGTGRAAGASIHENDFGRGNRRRNSSGLIIDGIGASVRPRIDRGRGLYRRAGTSRTDVQGSHDLRPLVFVRQTRAESKAEESRPPRQASAEIRHAGCGNFAWGTPKNTTPRREFVWYNGRLVAFG